MLKIVVFNVHKSYSVLYKSDSIFSALRFSGSPVRRDQSHIGTYYKSWGLQMLVLTNSWPYIFTINYLLNKVQRGKS